MGFVSGTPLDLQNAFCFKYFETILLIGVSKDDDGIFYMSWKDFLRHFDGVDVCCRSRDFDDIQLDLNEDWGICGPLLGCIFGIYI